MDQEHLPIELLESVHSFPGPYQVKVIGSADDDFVDRVLAAVHGKIASPTHLEHTIRATPGGRHVAVTMVIQVETAQQVREIYAAVKDLKGLAYLL